MQRQGDHYQRSIIRYDTKIKNTEGKRVYKVNDFFCGAGGMGLGDNDIKTKKGDDPSMFKTVTAFDEKILSRGSAVKIQGWDEDGNIYDEICLIKSVNMQSINLMRSHGSAMVICLHEMQELTGDPETGYKVTILSREEK
jgi:hypothetical protein